MGKSGASFLDNSGLWGEKTPGDMLIGTRTLVDAPARNRPDVPADTEMHDDATMAFIPMNHIRDAPRLRADSMHGYGFSTCRPVTTDRRRVPTITDATCRNARRGGRT